MPKKSKASKFNKKDKQKKAKHSVEEKRKKKAGKKRDESSSSSDSEGEDQQQQTKQTTTTTATTSKKQWALELGKNSLTNMKGLENLGNTCFFNSVMQSLAHTKEMAKHFIDFADVYNRAKESTGNAFAGSMTCALWIFYSQYYQLPNKALDTTFLLKQIWKDAPRFKGYQQQDSQELLRYLQNIAKDEYLKVIKQQQQAAATTSDTDKKEEEKNPMIPHYGPANNIIDKAFRSILCSSVLCHHCGNISRTFDEALDISIPIPRRPSATESLKDLFKQLCVAEKIAHDKNTNEVLNPDEILDYIGTLTEEEDDCSIANCMWGFTKSDFLSTKDDNGYICEKCSLVDVAATDSDTTTTTTDDSSNSPTTSEPASPATPATKKKIPRDASKQFSIYEPPQVLTLHLKRFLRASERTKKKRHFLYDFMNDGFVKNQDHVNFPFKLDIQYFMHPESPYQKQNNEYHLYAVVEHSGELNSGHYVAYVRQLSMHENGTGTDRDHEWFYISDSHVKKVTLAQVKKADAYLLFYERK